MRNMVLVTLALFVMAETARAEVYTMYTGPSATGPSVGSTVSLSMIIANTLKVPAGNFNGLRNVPVTGSLPVDMNLDASNSGTLVLPGGSLMLGDNFGTQSGGPPGSTYTISVSTNNLALAIQSGPVSVANGSFTIDTTTAGSLAINQGTLNYSMNIPFLDVQNVTHTVDFTATPFVFSFSDFGLRTITGTADDDLGGSDAVDSDPHTSGSPGLTGLSGIDTDGAEIRLVFAGLEVTSSIVSGTLNVPVTINLAGFITVGVPEVGSVVLVGMMSVGLFGMALRRRK